MQNWIYENKRYKDWFRANGRPEPLGVSISWKIYKENLRENVRKSRIFQSIFRITETISKYLSFCLKELSLCHKLWFSNPATSLQSDTVKELSFCHKLWFSYPYILSFQCRTPKIFQTMNYFRSNNDSLKYHRLTPSCCIYIAIWKSEFLVCKFIRIRKWVCGINSVSLRNWEISHKLLAGHNLVLIERYLKRCLNSEHDIIQWSPKPLE